MQTQSITTQLKFSSDTFNWYAKMRREAPVFFDTEQQRWMVFSYKDVKQALANWQMFSSKVPLPPEQSGITQSLPLLDPPKHRALRTLVAKVFTARRVEELAPRIMQITDELLDCAQDRDQMNFIHDFATPFPIIVIAEILGVPIECRADFKYWSDGIMDKQPYSTSSDDRLLPGID